MFEILLDGHAWATFALLIGLELVLGIDNILIISILAGRLPAHQRPLARRLGLGLACVARLIALLGVTTLQQMKAPVLFHLSWRDLILLAGGAFLLYKAVKEIHHVVEHPNEDVDAPKGGGTTLSSIITQIVLMDIVFSIDSVITAVGLTDNLWVIVAAVVVSFAIVLAFAETVANFVHKHPALKILALSFLVTIGVTLAMEAFHKEVPKAYIYLPMGFALAVELLQMRADHNKKRPHAGAPTPEPVAAGPGGPDPSRPS